MDIPAYQLRAGMYIAGRFTLFGLVADINFQMNTDGVQLRTALDFSAVRTGPVWFRVLCIVRYNLNQAWAMKERAAQ